MSSTLSRKAAKIISIVKESTPDAPVFKYGATSIPTVKPEEDPKVVFRVSHKIVHVVSFSCTDYNPSLVQSYHHNQRMNGLLPLVVEFSIQLNHLR